MAEPVKSSVHPVWQLNVRPIKKCSEYWALTSFKDLVGFIKTLDVSDLQHKMQPTCQMPPHHYNNWGAYWTKTSWLVENGQVFHLVGWWVCWWSEQGAAQCIIQVDIRLPCSRRSLHGSCQCRVNQCRVPAECHPSILSERGLTSYYIDLLDLMVQMWCAVKFQEALASVTNLPNCRNHRLALCLKHLMKTYPLLVEADSLLLAIWTLSLLPTAVCGI